MDRMDSTAVMPEAAETLTLYHGTTSLRLPSILAEGLTGRPYLTSEMGLAEYYAETAAEEEGGDPVVLEVTVFAPNLRYDRNAMDESVGSALDNRLFRLQRTPGLPPELREKLHKADVAFLQDRDAEAERMVTEIERECERLGIPLAREDAGRGGRTRGTVRCSDRMIPVVWMLPCPFLSERVRNR